jgi:hypothetical protein
MDKNDVSRDLEKLTRIQPEIKEMMSSTMRQRDRTLARPMVKINFH